MKDEAESKDIVLNKQVIRSVGEKVGKDWKKLAVELSFEEDEINYFESEEQSAVEKAVKILTIWMVGASSKIHVAKIFISIS